MTYIFKKNNILAVAMLSITLGTIASPASTNPKGTANLSAYIRLR